MWADSLAEGVRFSTGMPGGSFDQASRVVVSVRKSQSYTNELASHPLVANETPLLGDKLRGYNERKKFNRSCCCCGEIWWKLRMTLFASDPRPAC